MTRFARADGSKGSNKREEEEATPWSVLVQQIKNASAGDIEDEDDGFGDMEDEDEKSRDNILSRADELLGSESEDEDNGQELDLSLLDQSEDEKKAMTTEFSDKTNQLLDYIEKTYLKVNY